MAKVYLKPTPRASAVKISEFKNISADGGVKTEGKSLKKTKILPHCMDVIQPLWSKDLGAIDTGLREIVDNPYFESTENIIPVGFENALKGPKAKLQHVLEAKHGRPFDFYTDRAPRRDDKGPRTFYQDFKVSLGDMTNIIDTNNPHDELAYYMLKNSKYVASSELEWKTGKKPYALYYIADEKEEQEKTAQKARVKAKATALVVSDEMTPEMLRKFVKYIKSTDKDCKFPQGNLAGNQPFMILNDYVKDLNGAKNILEAHALLDSVPGRERFEAVVLLQQLLESYIVSNRQETYTWNSTKITLGNRKEDVIKFIMNPEKAQEVHDLKKELEAKFALA